MSLRKARTRVAAGALGVLAMSLACEGPTTTPPIDAGRDAPPRADAGVTYPPVVTMPDEREACAERDPLRRPLFGDLHVHTSFSFDAAAYDVRTRPADAYDFARGEEIGLPPYDASGAPTRTLRLARPLDFAAVTDHSEFLGEISLCTDPASPAYGSATCTSWRTADPRMGNYGEFTATLVGDPPRRGTYCRANPDVCAGALVGAWRETMDAAEAAYDRTSACAFTSFVAYEWTGTVAGTNLHRNVIFRNRSVPAAPTSFVEAPSAEALWRALDVGCNDTDSPCDVLAIPHNGNLGAGTMFAPVRDDGTPYDRADAERRARLEPLVEIYQHKGASECLDATGDPLGSEDELCRFEELHPFVCRGLPADPPGCAGDCDEGGGFGFLGGCIEARDLARGVLRTGLSELVRTGANPFELGFIGSTDTHQSLAGGTEEGAFRGHLGNSDDEPSEALALNRSVLIRGRTVSPGGLAVVWAEENSRESIFEGLRRRETYATSGTRIVVRFFAGPDIPADACTRADLPAVGYAGGVPMGGEIPTADTRAPRFVVSAMRDPMGAPLERIQLVVGWAEADGTTREQVIDLAGTAVSDLPDATTCAPPAGGSDTLCAVYEDPGFARGRPAFYYARVLEVPTCRWTRYACNEAAVDCASIDASDPLAFCCGPAEAHIVRERAWTSPVFWVPPAP